MVTSKNSPTTDKPPGKNQSGWIQWIVLGLFVVMSFVLTYGVTIWLNQPPKAPPGMVLIAAGEFQIGTAGNTSNRNETPAHAVFLDSFWIDAHEVTNAQFQAFVDQTGYVTTAEKAPDWE